MNELDPRARAIIDAAREGDRPSLADHDRIKKAILLQLAAGAAVSAGAAGSVAAAGTLSLAAKVGLTVLAVSVAGGGVATYVKVRGHHETARVERAHERQVTTARAESPSAPSSPPVAQSEPSPSAPASATPRRPDKPRRPEPLKEESIAPQDRLSAEVDVLKQARQELRLGRPAQALQVLADYEHRFGEGTLGEERRALSAIAACQAQPGAAARASASAFLRSAPRSPLAERVRVACATQSPHE
jgi:hypothetical protein